MIKSKLHVSNKNMETINLYNQDCKIAVEHSVPEGYVFICRGRDLNA